MFPLLATLPLLLLATDLVAYDAVQAQGFLRQHCIACHQGKSPAGGLKLDGDALASLQANPAGWNKLTLRVKNGEMPPRGVPGPAMADREAFTDWVSGSLRASACAGGILPGPYPMRRLNRDEYGATIRDLLNIHMNAGHALPLDGAGGEGFDNAAETLFFSPIHSEKYLEAAKEALDYAAKDPESRKKFLIAEPHDEITPERAAGTVLDRFVPTAFRRPALDGEVDRYMAIFRRALKTGESYDHAILLALEAVLVSPNFLFRSEPPNTGAEPRLVDDFSMASRLSYFLWGSMPDKALIDLALAKQLNTPDRLKAQVARMLKDPKARDFSERFVEQWLATRELGRDIKPDAKLFPKYYDAELTSAIRYEPILFFQAVLAKDLPLTDLIDANFTFLTDKLAKHYGLKIKGAGQQPKRFDLPEDSHRGGVLTMAASLAVSSYPQRTSPVLRGKWILENILGTPPPPPPPDVPALADNHPGAALLTLRERLEQHRANPACASCHNRIDPMGFALENFDAVGVWRNEDAGKPVDNEGELPDGTKFRGPDELKKVLLTRRDAVLRNFTSKMLGYALGRGLTLNDSCTVDSILSSLAAQNYSSQTLIREIVLSVPFRYAAPARAATKSMEMQR